MRNRPYFDKINNQPLAVHQRYRNVWVSGSDKRNISGQSRWASCEGGCEVAT
jgi:hypothetical protein